MCGCTCTLLIFVCSSHAPVQGCKRLFFSFLTSEFFFSIIKKKGIFRLLLEITTILLSAKRDSASLETKLFQNANTVGFKNPKLLQLNKTWPLPFPLNLRWDISLYLHSHFINDNFINTHYLKLKLGVILYGTHSPLKLGWFRSRPFMRDREGLRHLAVLLGRVLFD